MLLLLSAALIGCGKTVNNSYKIVTIDEGGILNAPPLTGDLVAAEEGPGGPRRTFTLPDGTAIETAGGAGARGVLVVLINMNDGTDQAASPTTTVDATAEADLKPGGQLPPEAPPQRPGPAEATETRSQLLEGPAGDR